MPSPRKSRTSVSESEGRNAPAAVAAVVAQLVADQAAAVGREDGRHCCWRVSAPAAVESPEAAPIRATPTGSVSPASRRRAAIDHVVLIVLENPPRAARAGERLDTELERVSRSPIRRFASGCWPRRRSWSRQSLRDVCATCAWTSSLSLWRCGLRRVLRKPPTRPHQRDRRVSRRCRHRPVADAVCVAQWEASSERLSVVAVRLDATSSAPRTRGAGEQAPTRNASPREQAYYGRL